MKLEADDIKLIIEDQIRKTAALHNIVIDSTSFIPSYVMSTPPGHYPLTTGSITGYDSPVRFNIGRTDMTIIQSVINFKIIGNSLQIKIEALVRGWVKNWSGYNIGGTILPPKQIAPKDIPLYNDQQVIYHKIIKQIDINLYMDDIICQLSNLFEDFFKKIDTL